MSARFAARVVELPTIHDGKLPEWIHLVPLGAWFYPPWKKTIEISAAVARQIFERLLSYETRLPIDYEHRSHEAQATSDDQKVVCYVAEYELRDDGVWGKPDVWTADGARDVGAGKFRYISPVVFFKKPHKKTGDIGPELTDAAVTNHPRMDGIKSFFAEPFPGDGESTTSNERSNAMLEKLKLWLTARGTVLAADAGDDKVWAAFEAEQLKMAERVPDLVGAALGAPEGEFMTAADAEKAIVALAEKVPADLATALGNAEIVASDAVGQVMELRQNKVKASERPFDAAAIAADVQQRFEDKLLLAEAVKNGGIPLDMQAEYEALLASENPDTRKRMRKVIAAAKPSGPLAPGINENTGRPEGAMTAADTAALAEACAQMGMTPAEVEKLEKEAAHG